MAAVTDIAGFTGTAERTRHSRVASPTVGDRTRRLTLFVAAALSLEAAWAHLWLVPETFFDWWGFGAFFLAVGLAQVVLAVALLHRPVPVVLVAGIAGNLAVVTGYVLSRTIHFPVGPHAGEPETVEVLGITATAGELVLIAALVSLLSGRTRRWVLNALVLWGVALWALRASESLL